MAVAEALLIDIDGVLVVSWEAIAGAPEALEQLRSAGVGIRFLTNTTSRPLREITAGLRAAGFGVSSDEIITAASATAAYLTARHPGARCLLLNSGDVRSDLTDVELVGPDAAPGDVDVVVIGGAGPEFGYEALNHAFACLDAGAELVAMHRNLLWRTAAGLALDAGPFVIALEQAAGVSATVVGKPGAAMFAAALESLGRDASSVAMVGDDLDNDVRAAQRLGITGVQVCTGKFRAAQLERGTPPDVVLASFADVPVWLEGDDPRNG